MPHKGSDNDSDNSLGSAGDAQDGQSDAASSHARRRAARHAHYSDGDVRVGEQLEGGTVLDGGKRRSTRERKPTGFLELQQEEAVAREAAARRGQWFNSGSSRRTRSGRAMGRFGVPGTGRRSTRRSASHSDDDAGNFMRGGSRSRPRGGHAAWRPGSAAGWRNAPEGSDDSSTSDSMAEGPGQGGGKEARMRARAAIHGSSSDDSTSRHRRQARQGHSEDEDSDSPPRGMQVDGGMVSPPRPGHSRNAHESALSKEQKRQDAKDAGLQPLNIGDAAKADAAPMASMGPPVTWASVGGLQEHVRAVKELVALPLLYPEVFGKFGLKPPKGVLFHGPPGTGKTLVARALAASASAGGRQVAFFMRKGADCLSKWVGEAERQLRLLFQQAAAHAPAVIFFDELDGLAPVRSSRQDQIHASIVATLLALMDGLDDRGQVIVIGATNRVDSIDPALRRPGRFDRELAFGLPGGNSRSEILGIHTKAWDPPLAPSFKQQLAHLTGGYSGADLRALCAEAAVQAVRRRYPQVYTTDAKLAIDTDAIRVTAGDWVGALRSVVPTSARVSGTPGVALPQHLQGLLGPVLQQTLAAIRTSFPVPQVKACLDCTHSANATGVPAPQPPGSGAGGGDDDAASVASYLYDSDDTVVMGGMYGPTKAEAEAAASAVARAGAPLFPAQPPATPLDLRTVLQAATRGLQTAPRLILRQEQCAHSSSQVPNAASATRRVASAVLHALEDLPVFEISLQALMSDRTSVGEPLASLISTRIASSRSQAPSILFLPSIGAQWEALDDVGRAALVDGLASMPPSAPVLMLATLEASDSPPPSVLMKLLAPPIALQEVPPALLAMPAPPLVAASEAASAGTGGTDSPLKQGSTRHLASPPAFSFSPGAVPPSPIGVPHGTGASAPAGQSSSMHSLLSAAIKSLTQPLQRQAENSTKAASESLAARLERVTVWLRPPSSEQLDEFVKATLNAAVPLHTDAALPPAPAPSGSAASSAGLPCSQSTLAAALETVTSHLPASAPSAPDQVQVETFGAGRASRVALRRAVKRHRSTQPLEELPPPPPPSPPKPSAEEMAKLMAREDRRLTQLRVLLRQVLAELAKDRKLRALARPVDPEEVPDYYDVIQEPMDLSTMNEKVDEGAYLSYAEFGADLDLILANARRYNPPSDQKGQAIVRAAHSMRDIANTMSRTYDRRVGGGLLKRCEEIATRRRAEEAKQPARKRPVRRRAPPRARVQRGLHASPAALGSLGALASSAAAPAAAGGEDALLEQARATGGGSSPPPKGVVVADPDRLMRELRALKRKQAQLEAGRDSDDQGAQGSDDGAAKQDSQDSDDSGESSSEDSCEDTTLATTADALSPLLADVSIAEPASGRKGGLSGTQDSQAVPVEGAQKRRRAADGSMVHLSQSGEQDESASQGKACASGDPAEVGGGDAPPLEQQAPLVNTVWDDAITHSLRKQRRRLQRRLLRALSGWRVDALDAAAQQIADAAKQAAAAVAACSGRGMPVLVPTSLLAPMLPSGPPAEDAHATEVLLSLPTAQAVNCMAAVGAAASAVLGSSSLRSQAQP